VKDYSVEKMKEVKEFYSKSKDIQDIGDDIPSNWRKILSNFYPTPIMMNGKSYYTLEHYFHSAKAMYSNKPEMSKIFEVGGSVGPNPLDAKRAGGKGSYNKEKAVLDLQSWDKNRDRIMYEGLLERERTDKMFSKILKRTKSRDIYLLHFERTGVKSYWGGSYKDGVISGSNVLGRMMMMLRENISESPSYDPASPRYQVQESPSYDPASPRYQVQESPSYDPEENDFIPPESPPRSPSPEIEPEGEPTIMTQEEEEARLFREAFEDLSV